MAKPIQYCKVISLQLKSINLLKKKKGHATPSTASPQAQPRPLHSPAPHGLVPRTPAGSPPSQSPVLLERRLGLTQFALRAHGWCVCVLSHFSRVRLFTTPWHWPTRLCPWNFPGKNVRVGCHALPQGSS